jgi:hypothetical protein
MEYALSEIQARIDRAREKQGITKEQAYKTCNWLKTFQDEEKKEKSERKKQHIIYYGNP